MKSGKGAGGDGGLQDDSTVPHDGEVGDGGCAHGEPCGPAGICCSANQECVNDWQCLPICENERCGENGAVCCDAGEICLDGEVCARDCASE